MKTQTDRLVEYLKNQGQSGATSFQVIMDCSIINVTGRVSDARKEGHVIECRKVKSNRNSKKFLYTFVYQGKKQLLNLGI